jgi:hypothetical protein
LRVETASEKERDVQGRDRREIAKMLLLEPHNLLIQTILTEKFATNPPTGVDQVITDFDNVQFHLSNPTGPDDKPVKTIIHLSMLIKCYKDLLQYGAKDVLQREYGDMIIAPEQGYDVTIEIDLEKPPSSQGPPPLPLPLPLPHHHSNHLCPPPNTLNYFVVSLPY